MNYKQKFCNGFNSWQETHFEVVSYINYELSKDVPSGVIGDTYEASGTGGMYELAENWTDEFEEMFDSEDWTERDYFETIHEYCKTKNMKP